MATYRTVHISFWTDPKVDDDFTPEDKYFYLYLLTNPHTNICGCYEISMKQMVRETGYNEDTVKRLLNRMEYVHNVIQYDKNTKEVLVPKWGKYNWCNSPKTKEGAVKSVENIKSNRFRKFVSDTLCIGYEYPMDTSVTVTVTDTVSDTVSANKRPTLEEVKAYCKERKNKVDPERWFDYYTSNGWKVGKNPMKDWKAAVRTWERQTVDRSRKNNTLLNYDERGSVKEIKLDLSELDPDPPKKRKKDYFSNYKESGVKPVNFDDIALTLEDEL